MKTATSIWFIFVIFLSNSIRAQYHFVINGESEFYNNKQLSFSPISVDPRDSTSTDLNLKTSKVRVENNRFTVTGTVRNSPQALEITYSDPDKKHFYLVPFLIDNRSASYTLHLGDLSRTVGVEIPESKTQAEYLAIQKQMTAQKIQMMPFDPENFQKKSAFLQKYISQHPESFAALWMLVSDYRFIGYREAIKTNLNLFGKSVQKSGILGQITASLQNDEIFGEGKKFPEIPGISNRFVLGKKYTLIDFWFSSCVPCLEEIPDLKKLYSRYKDQGFAIIAVATDRTRAVPNWKRVIRVKEIPWQNLLDENGIETKKLNIIRFPTTYLLNEKGEIILRNPTPEDLNIFLEKNLR